MYFSPFVLKSRQRNTFDLKKNLQMSELQVLVIEWRDKKKQKNKA